MDQQLTITPKGTFTIWPYEEQATPHVKFGLDLAQILAWPAFGDQDGVPTIDGGDFNTDRLPDRRD
ncbi:MAG: hypothetical protein A3G24_13490 [Betaproteobacteria bacterium RIFCSPLOWO2_12_FULL_62_13]|nr:MAG: hypothetical protein A3G24_13490 [Betaproteobacteria bacterium RIFCSPLOWO2_12_FULL_62_13]